jgi:O-methyltransferase involved in polyketide biosynthesis
MSIVLVRRKAKRHEEHTACPASQSSRCEVDQPENVDPKRVRLRTRFGTIPAHVMHVPIDFDTEDVGTVLASCRFARDRHTFFIWEAVMQ